MSQVTDLVAIESNATTRPVKLPASSVIRREVLTKTQSGRRCIRKAVVWKTNKAEIEPLYPAYVVFFTDYSPGREHPLKTAIRISSSLEVINKIADTWLKEHATQRSQTRGWQHPNEDQSVALPDTCRKENKLQLELGISFSRSSSMNFSLAVSRIKSLAKVTDPRVTDPRVTDPKPDPLVIEHDPKGRPLQYSLVLKQDMIIENARKLRNLLKIILPWKGTEFTLNGEPLKINEIYELLGKLDNIVTCWMRQKRNGQACRNTFALGCGKLKFEPASGFPGLPQERPAWYAVGKFEDNIVTIDKPNLIDQLSSYKNELPGICPLYEADKIRQRIEALPERLDSEKDPNRWIMGYSGNTGKAAWVFPKEHRYFPFGITTQTNAPTALTEYHSDTSSVNSPSSNAGFGLKLQLTESETQTVSLRNVPQTRYADICGQDSAVEQVRDYAELPLKYPDIFKQVGIRPGRGILLWGPPGNGKTLLARAVAGESGAHIEIISGPELLSKWVGEAERNLRETFQRAAALAPAVIIMDEVDAIAASRNGGDLGYLRVVVSQLLVLMDGLADRGRVLIIGATNCPDAIDPAILRPGRIDRKIFMGQPDKHGRALLLGNLLNKMSVCENIQIHELAEITDSFSGAEIEHAINEAGLLAIKEALKNNPPTTPVKISTEHLLRSISHIKKTMPTKTKIAHATHPATIVSPYKYFSPHTA
jgi:AAA+ superfamily predicted ATPase